MLALPDASPQRTPPPLAPGASPVLLFDGVCTLCDGFVRFVLARERVAAAPLRFGALQGEAARPYLAAAGLAPDHLDSLVYVHDGRALVGAEAVRAVLRHLRAPWPTVATFLGAVPPPLRAAGYRLVARYRYRLFGRADACRLPTPEERARLL